MRARRWILLAAGALLASRVGAQGSTGSSNQQPPSDQKSWYQEGEDAVKEGASSAGKALNEAGQSATDTVVGTKTVTGRITKVSEGQVTLKKSDDGSPMNLGLTDSTKVTVGGKEGSAGSLRPGDEVRASYAQSGGSSTARKIEVQKAPASGSSGAGATGSESESK
jgi:hypothetical protein